MSKNSLKPEFGYEEGKRLSGKDQNLRDIDQYVKPFLHELGIDIFAVKDIPEKLHGIIGNLHLIHIDGISAKLQIIVILDVDYIQTHCRFNMPKRIIESIPERKRIDIVFKQLRKEKIYILLFTLTDWFFFSSYSDIPKEQWEPTYRKETHEVDRMFLPPTYLKGKFQLKTKFKETLLNHMKNENSKG